MARKRDQIRLVFFRLNYPHWWERSALLKVARFAFHLPEGEKGVYRKTSFYTGDFAELKSGNMLFKLGKAREDLRHTTVKAEGGFYVFREEGDEPVVPYITCLFAPDKKLVIAEVTQEISWQQIQGSLQGILAEARERLVKDKKVEDELGNIRLQPLGERASFEQWVKEQEEVSYISFKFWPTNPSPWPSFREWDAALREAKADETNLKLRNKGNGLEVHADLVKMGMAQVEAGYGSASATGRAGTIKRLWSSVKETLMLWVRLVTVPEEIEKEWLKAAEDAETTAKDGQRTPHREGKVGKK